MNFVFVICFIMLLLVSPALNDVFEESISANPGVVGLILSGVYIIFGLPSDIFGVISIILKLILSFLIPNSS